MGPRHRERAACGGSRGRAAAAPTLTPVPAVCLCPRGVHTGRQGSLPAAGQLSFPEQPSENRLDLGPRVKGHELGNGPRTPTQCLKMKWQLFPKAQGDGEDNPMTQPDLHEGQVPPWTGRELCKALRLAGPWPRPGRTATSRSSACEGLGAWTVTELTAASARTGGEVALDSPGPQRAVL